MLVEQPRVQWAPGVLRIVMLVASDLIGSGTNHRAIIAGNQAVRFTLVLQLMRTSVLRASVTCADVWSRQAVGNASEETFLPPGGSNGRSMLHRPDATLANRAPIRLPSGASNPPLACLATRCGLSFRTFRPTWNLPIASRLSRHLRFARSAPRAFHARFPTLLRASLPSRLVELSCSLSGG